MTRSSSEIWDVSVEHLPGACAAPYVAVQHFPGTFDTLYAAAMTNTCRCNEMDKAWWSASVLQSRQGGSVSGNEISEIRTRRAKVKKNTSVGGR